MSGNELVGREKSTLIWTSNASTSDDDEDVNVSERAICAGAGQKDELRYMGMAVRPVKDLQK